MTADPDHAPLRLPRLAQRRGPQPQDALDHLGHRADVLIGDPLSAWLQPHQGRSVAVDEHPAHDRRQPARVIGQAAQRRRLRHRRHRLGCRVELESIRGASVRRHERHRLRVTLVAPRTSCQVRRGGFEPHTIARVKSPRCPSDNPRTATRPCPRTTRASESRRRPPLSAGCAAAAHRRNEPCDGGRTPEDPSAAPGRALDETSWVGVDIIADEIDTQSAGVIGSSSTPPFACLVSAFRSATSTYGTRIPAMVSSAIILTMATCQ
jgi:hypothetical protein